MPKLSGYRYVIILVAEGGTTARVLIAILTEYQLYLAQAYMCH